MKRNKSSAVNKDKRKSNTEKNFQKPSKDVITITLPIGLLLSTVVYMLAKDWIMFLVGLIVLIDQSTNLTDWYLSTNDDPQSYNGVTLSKRNRTLVVSFVKGII